jgi:hypothetical protein
MARNGVKSGGRKKGSLNKKTQEQKNRAERVLNIIDKKYLAKDITLLTSAQRMQLYASMMEFVSPKLQRIDAKVAANVNLADQPITFE